MTKIKLLFSAAFAAAVMLAPMPLQAARVAQNGAEAQKLVQDDGYIIFIYADGWDEFSEARCRQLMADAAIRKAAGKAVFMPLAYPECADEARWQKQREYLGGLRMPTPSSFPALIFLDRDSRHYATLKGREVSRGTTAELAELVADRLSKGRERRRLLAEAEQTPGPARALLLFKAYQIDGLSWMDKDVQAAIRKADPNNETGVITALNFNAYGFANNIAKNGVAAGKAEVDKMLANPVYTPRQKQQMCAAAIGMLRRQGGLAEADSMRRYARLMQELVPGSPEGRAADRILREWIPGLRYGRGWNPSCVPTERKAIEMEGELPIREAGTYTVRFTYGWGRMALVVHGVELYDGERKVAEDIHRGVAGHDHWQNVYTLTVPRALKKPRLFITLGQGDNDSNGSITIEKK